MAYIKKTWERGDVLTETDLNRMETGIEQAQPITTNYLINAVVDSTTTPPTKVTFTNKDASTTVFDVADALALRQADLNPPNENGKYLCSVAISGSTKGGVAWADGTSGTIEWGNVTGNISNQTDLNTALLNLQNNKVEKIPGKGLSTNDLTNDLKTLYDGYNTKKQKTLTAGDNITLTPTGDTVTISAASGTTYVAGDGLKITAGTPSSTISVLADGDTIAVGASGIKVADNKFVEATRKVNGKTLDADVTLTGEDIAVSATDTTKINVALDTKALKTTKVNTKELSADITLYGSDIAVTDAAGAPKIDVALAAKQDAILGGEAIEISADNKTINVKYDNDSIIKDTTSGKLKVSPDKYISKLASTTINKVIVSADAAGAVKESPILIDADAKITNVASIAVTGTDWSNIKNANATNNTLKDALDAKQDNLVLGDGVEYDSDNKLTIKKRTTLVNDATNGLGVNPALAIDTLTTTGLANVNSFKVGSNAEITGDGNATFAGTATITGAATLGNTLAVADNATFAKNITMASGGILTLGSISSFNVIQTAGDPTATPPVAAVTLQSVLDKKLSGILLKGVADDPVELTDRVDDKVKITLLEMANTLTPTEPQKEAEKCAIARPDSIRALINTAIATIKELYTYKEVTDAAEFPTAAIADGGIHIIVSDLNPTQRYDGYIYLTKK